MSFERKEEPFINERREIMQSEKQLMFNSLLLKRQIEDLEDLYINSKEKKRLKNRTIVNAMDNLFNSIYYNKNKLMNIIDRADAILERVKQVQLVNNHSERIATMVNRISSIMENKDGGNIYFTKINFPVIDHCALNYLALLGILYENLKKNPNINVHLFYNDDYKINSNDLFIIILPVECGEEGDFVDFTKNYKYINKQLPKKSIFGRVTYPQYFIATTAEVTEEIIKRVKYEIEG